MSFRDDVLQANNLKNDFEIGIEAVWETPKKRNYDKNPFWVILKN